MQRRNFIGRAIIALYALFKPSSSNAEEQLSLLEEIPIAAKWVSEALTSSGYKADFTPESLQEIERFFREHTVDGEAKPGGLLSEQTVSRVWAIGAYCGEVVRKVTGGHWETDDEDPDAAFNLRLVRGNGGICWPMQRVGKRFRDPENDMVFWGKMMMSQENAGP